MTTILNHRENNIQGYYMMIDEELPNEGIELRYTGGSTCPSGGPYSLTVNIICNKKNENQPIYTIDVDSLSNPCSPGVLMSSSSGCPVVVASALTKFYLRFYYYLAAPMVIIGFLLVIYGGRHPTKSLLTLTALIVGTILLVGIY